MRIMLDAVTAAQFRFEQQPEFVRAAFYLGYGRNAIYSLALGDDDLSVSKRALIVEDALDLGMSAEDVVVILPPNRRF